MCGITGIVGAKSTSQEELAETVSLMANQLAHRGPDGQGIWIDANGRCGLGHRRLAIVELSPAGAQPMISDSGRYVVSFNGEIYNHLELRKRLQADGARDWRGLSDTETLVACIETWGVRPTVERCVGMFAFAVWDRLLQRLTLVRDRMGEKPLYYGFVGSAFAFASELKSFRALPGWSEDNLSLAALSQYFRVGYVPAPLSIYDRVRQLPPGSLLMLDTAPSLSPVVERYWSAADQFAGAAGQPSMTEEEALDALEHALLDSVRLMRHADVPVGTFLSGGIDSSLVTALLQEVGGGTLKTFAIGFEEEPFNEAPHAAAIARFLGTEHHELRVTNTAALGVVQRLPEIWDEPFADSSQIPTYLVSRLARQDVTVALSGDGGDELFFGYRRYPAVLALHAKGKLLPATIRSLAQTLLLSHSEAWWDRKLRVLPARLREAVNGRRLYKLARFLGDLNARSLYAQALSQGVPEDCLAFRSLPLSMDWRETLADPGLQMMCADLEGYLPGDILTKVDRAAMAVSLETRAPFLDHRVVELAARLPFALKYRRGQQKYILKKLLARRLPRPLFDRPKMGFGIPLAQWLRGDLKPWAEELLAPALVQRQGLLDAGRVWALWKEHQSGSKDLGYALWVLLMFQAWRTRFGG